MKRLISIAISLIAALAAHAVPLFPYFVDVAGDFKEGTPAELAALNIPCKFYNIPSFYKNLNSADSFLNDVLPTSREPISRSEKTIGNTRIVIYTSPIDDTLIGPDATSTLWLVEIPDVGFYAAYAELPAAP